MRRKKRLIACMGLMFLSGLALFLYPIINGRRLEREAADAVDGFIARVQKPNPRVGTEKIEEPFPLQTDVSGIRLDALLASMQEYNREIWADGQAALKANASAYCTAAIDLSAYGVPEGIAGVITISDIGVRLPVYLGATESNMAKGAVHLGGTSLPIGGAGTNCLIAAHRGYRGADYFRYLDRLCIGDVVEVTNLWETLTYRVSATEIIEPDNVSKMLIQEGRDMLTLVTCHPYASSGPYRLVVYCERTK